MRWVADVTVRTLRHSMTNCRVGASPSSSVRTLAGRVDGEVVPERVDRRVRRGGSGDRHVRRAGVGGEEVQQAIRRHEGGRVGLPVERERERQRDGGRGGGAGQRQHLGGLDVARWHHSAEIAEAVGSPREVEVEGLVAVDEEVLGERRDTLPAVGPYVVFALRHAGEGVEAVDVRQRRRDRRADDGHRGAGRRLASSRTRPETAWAGAGWSVKSCTVVVPSPIATALAV